MGFNINTLSVTNRSTNLPGHAALAASFNQQSKSPQRQWDRRGGSTRPCSTNSTASRSARKNYGSISELQGDLDDWVKNYNECFSKTQMQTFASARRRSCGENNRRLSKPERADPDQTPDQLLPVYRLSRH